MPTNPMNITPPVPEQTTGPSWATQINAILTDQIATHDHTSNKGVQITPAGMNISSDLSMQSNNLVSARSVRLANQISAISEATDVGCLYELNGELIYIDGNGQAVPITSNGAIDVASVGGINGLPAGTAQVGFSVDTYTFKKSSTGYANMDHGQIKVRSSDEVSPAYGTTIKVPTGMAADYDLTLPITPPTTNPAFVVMGTNGTLNVSTSTANGITRANLAPVGQLVVGPITALSQTGTGWTDVPSFTGTLTTTGRPVFLSLQSTPNVSSTGTDGFNIQRNAASTAAGTSYISFNIDGSKYSPFTLNSTFGVSGIAFNNPFNTIVLLAAGTHTIKVQYNKNTADSMTFQNCYFVAYEL